MEGSGFIFFHDWTIVQCSVCTSNLCFDQIMLPYFSYKLFNLGCKKEFWPPPRYFARAFCYIQLSDFDLVQYDSCACHLAEMKSKQKLLLTFGSYLLLLPFASKSNEISMSSHLNAKPPYSTTMVIIQLLQDEIWDLVNAML